MVESVAPPRRRDRASVVGIAAGVIGVAAGNITLTWTIACLFGAVAVILGAWRLLAHREPGRPGSGVAATSLALGVVAVILGIVGAIQVEEFFSSTPEHDAFVLTPD